MFLNGLVYLDYLKAFIGLKHIKGVYMLRNTIEVLIQERVNKLGIMIDDGSKLNIWGTELIVITDRTESEFPTWNCIWYGAKQTDGTVKFKIRFIKDNYYLEDIPKDIRKCKVEVSL